MSIRVLNVAEKPSVAKAIAETLGRGGSYRPGRSKYNPVYEFPYDINDNDFPEPYNKGWSLCDPLELFTMEIKTFVPEQRTDIARNLEQEARNCQWLILWLDCDREGENIAFEVIEVCSKVKRNLDIYRAHFSDLSPASLRRAVSNLKRPNQWDSEAVEVRRELDLRLGAIFTRYQTLRLGNKFKELQVDRFWKMKCHIPETFYSIKCTVEKGGQSANLKWARGHLFDRLSCFTIYEMCVENPTATVTSLQSKPTKKWKPYPLTTVDLQKGASKFLRISSAECMQVAEKLYNEGYLSYPRTETAGFADDFDLHSLVRHQTNHPNWGNYALSLLNDGKFNRPRKGKGDDKSHPPIHPTKSGEGLGGVEARVYEFVARHFLACCSADAQGQETNVELQIVDEIFRCQGLMITERNFLDVYTYWKWDAKTIPHFTQGETLTPTSLFMNEGETTAAKLLTEEELIGLMDKNGIGTDATIAEHINTILKRGYVVKEGREFKPTTLGEALVAGYNSIGMRILSQPNLRAKTEADMKGIVEQRKTKRQVLDENIEMYRRVYLEIVKETPKLAKALGVYFQRGTSLDFDVEKKNFSKCGKCLSMMSLRTDSKTEKSGLFCPTCDNSFRLPSGDITPHDHVCPLCNYGVLNVLSKKNTEYQICPHCYNNPPDDYQKATEGTSTLDITMPCWKCFADCPLATGTNRSLPVMACPMCGKDMTVRKNSKGVLISCSGYPGCSKTLWLPKELTSVTATNQACPEAKYSSPVYKLQVTLSKGAVPPGHPSSYLACICGCDELMNEYLGSRNRFSRWTTANDQINPKQLTQTTLNKSFNQLSRGLSTSTTSSTGSRTAFSRNTTTATTTTTTATTAAATFTPAFQASRSSGASSSNTTWSSNNSNTTTTTTNSFNNNYRNNFNNNTNNNYNNNNNNNNNNNFNNNSTNNFSGGRSWGGGGGGGGSGWGGGSGGSGSGGGGGSGSGKTVNCRCGVPALYLVCRKNNQNQGRGFHKCETCKFFEWDDELGNGGGDSGGNRFVGGGGGSGSTWSGEGEKKRKFAGKDNNWKSSKQAKTTSTNTKGIRSCSICKQPGHNIRKCPQRTGDS